MSSLQSKHSSQHHQAAFNSLKINLKYCKFQINFNCVQMGRKSASSEIKWQVIGMARIKNHTNVQIGKILHVSEYCVRKTIKTWELTKDVSDMLRTGRPSKLSNRDKSGMFRMSRENPKLSYKKLAQIFNESKNNPKVSRELVRRTLLDKGIGTYIAARKPILSITDKRK